MKLSSKNTGMQYVESITHQIDFSWKSLMSQYPSHNKTG